MSRFWGVRGHFTEGRQRLMALLGDTADPTAIRVRALNGAASLAIDQGDYTAARDVLGESIQLSRELGDRRGEATALTYLARPDTGFVTGSATAKPSTAPVSSNCHVKGIST